MAQGDPQGWESLGTNKPNEYQATLDLNRAQGVGQVKQRVRVITNKSNGNYDVYTTAFGSGDQLIYSYNASTNTIPPETVNRGIFDQMFTGTRKSQLDTLNTSVRRATLTLAGNNASGPNTSSSTNLETLKNLPGYRSLANTAQSSSQNGDPQTTPRASSEEISTAVTDLQSQVKDGYVRTQYGNLRYPIDRDTKQDYIKFAMLRYSPRSINANEINSDTGDIFGTRGKNRSIFGTVTLPIQPSITDTNMVRWGESDMPGFAAYGALESLTIIQNGPGGAEDSANRASQTLQQNAGAFKALVGTKLAEAAVSNQGGRLFTRVTGGIVNPNLELLFEGPLLRSFTFNFKLSARDGKEAKEIKKIIRFFKQGMSVKRSSTGLFLKSPNTFAISYIYGPSSKDHPWINKIKECALQNFSVSYTPEANYATYLDGSMTSYELSLTFGELDPIYEDDYKEADESVGGGLDSSIGY